MHSYSPLLWASSLVIVWLFTRGWVRRTKASIVVHAHDPSPAAAKSIDGPSRKWGDWSPSAFVCPDITPCGTALENILPRPYRPFKPGPYRTNMGIKPMPWDEWVELDKLYGHYHHIRENRIKTRGSHVVRTLPVRDGLVAGGQDAAIELLQDFSRFLSQRYPDTFTVVYGCDEGHDIVQITIIPLDITYDLRKGDPLQTVALLIQDDIALLIEGTDGKYYLQGGAILCPGSWRLDEKIGMSLDGIHITGEVPHFKQALQPSLMKFFRRLNVDTPYSRNNYGFQVVNRDSPDALDPDELAWCSTTMGPESFEDHPQAVTNPPIVKPSTIIFRSERQTLRRLPRTGAIAFTIRTYLTPLVDLAKEPGVPERLASAVRGWDEETWKYKKGHLYGEVLLEYLDRCSQ